MLCLLRWTRGDVGAEAGIKVCLAIVLGVVVVVVAEEEGRGRGTSTKQSL